MPKWYSKISSKRCLDPNALLGSSKASNKVLVNTKPLHSDNSDCSERLLQSPKKLQNFDNSLFDVHKSRPSMLNNKFAYPPTVFQNYVNQNKSAPYVKRNNMLWNSKEKQIDSFIKEQKGIYDGNKAGVDTSSLLVDLSNVLQRDQPCTPTINPKIKHLLGSKRKLQPVEKVLNQVGNNEVQQHCVNGDNIPEFTLGPRKFPISKNKPVKALNCSSKPNPSISNIPNNPESVNRSHVMQNFYSIEASGYESPDSRNPVTQKSFKNDESLEVIDFPNSKRNAQKSDDFNETPEFKFEARRRKLPLLRKHLVYGTKRSSTRRNNLCRSYMLDSLKFD